MDNKRKAEKYRKMVVNNQHCEVLDELIELASGSKEHNALIALHSRINRIEKRQLENTISQEEAEREINKISKSVLVYINKVLFVEKEVKSKDVYSEKEIEHDKRQFRNFEQWVDFAFIKAIVNDLEDNSSIEIIYWDRLIHLLDFIEDPSNGFLIESLENYLKEFALSIQNLTLFISENFSLVNENDKYYHSKKYKLPFNVLLAAFAEKYQERVESISAEASKLGEKLLSTYKDLIKEIKRKLII